MQTIVVDIDTGDIGAKLTHLTRHLGDPTLIVESGGRTPEGAHKLHVWWKLSEPATDADVEQVCALRGAIAAKVAGDTHFRSAHQPIRVPGTIYHKGGSQRMVQILQHTATGRSGPLRVYRDGFRHAGHARGVGMEPGVAQEKPGLADVLTTPVHEGVVMMPESRFEGASAAIGHYIRLVHDGRISR